MSDYEYLNLMHARDAARERWEQTRSEIDSETYRALEAQLADERSRRSAQRGDYA